MTMRSRIAPAGALSSKPAPVKFGAVTPARRSDQAESSGQLGARSKKRSSKSPYDCQARLTPPAPGAPQDTTS